MLGFIFNFFRLQSHPEHILNGVGPDHGPLYMETDLSQFVAEPFNAISAFIFVMIAVIWAYRLRRKYHKFSFMSVSIAILFIGGVGGTIYHAFRAHPFFLYMDYVPILILAVAVAIYLWVKVLPKWWLVLLILPVFVFINRLIWGTDELTGQMKNSLSYINTAMVIMVPLTAYLIKTRFKNSKYILLAFLSFGLAVFGRMNDGHILTEVLPMGTHFLWHLFGAGACIALAEYLFHVRVDEVRREIRLARYTHRLKLQRRMRIQRTRMKKIYA